MKLNPLRFFKSLSARLLLLTLIWVSFIVTTIGYTLMLNWKLESSSAATNIIGDIRFHVFRTALYVLPQYDNRDFDNVAMETQILGKVLIFSRRVISGVRFSCLRRRPSVRRFRASTLSGKSRCFRTLRPPAAAPANR